MPNYGFLNNIASGMKEGLITYQTIQNMKNQQSQTEQAQKLQAQKMRMEAAQHGLIESQDPDTGEVGYQTDPDSFARDLKEREFALQSADKGLIETMDPATGKYKYSADPEAHKRAIELARQKAEASRDPMTDLLRNEQYRKALDEGRQRDFEKTPQGKISKLSGEQKKRVDQSAAAVKAIRDMGAALGGIEEDAEPGLLGKLSSSSKMMEIPFRGDTDFTESRRRFEEYLGRLESGGAIGLGESARFMKMAPGPLDSPEMKQRKLEKMEEDLLAVLETGAGVSSEEAEGMGLIQPKKVKETKASGPKPGEVLDGYEFLGGDPSDQKSWRKK